MFRTTLTKLDGTKFDAIATTDFNYEKDSKWLYAHGFRYTNAAYNRKAGMKEPKAMFHVNEAAFAKKYPKEYAIICKRDGIKPISKKAEPKAEPKKADPEVMELLAELKKQNAILKGQLTKLKKAAAR